MRNDDSIRIRHMYDAAKEALGFCNNITRRDFDSNRMLVLALMKDIEIIGEAAARINDDFKNKFPQVPWTHIIGMRNRLIHAYFDINLDILWKTIQEDIPPLIAELEKVIRS